MITKEAMLSMLKQINEDKEFDVEDKHLHADSLLLDYIDDEEISEAFNKIEKWYS